MQRLTGTADDLTFLAERLRAGDLLALPTETVYGLAANVHDEAACRRIFDVKGRPLLDPLIVHVGTLEAAERLAVWNDVARTLAAHFWPGPLTLVLPKRPIISALVTAGHPTVALRQPRHPLCRALLAGHDLAVAAPSANPFGYVSPTRLEHVAAQLGDRVPWGLDGGPCEVGLESTILQVSDAGQVGLLRPGGLPVEAVEAVLGRPVVDARPVKAPSAGLVAPGLLERHYSPRTPLRLFNADEQPAPEVGEAVVWQARPALPSGAGIDDFWLSEAGSLDAVARELFTMLRRLDEGHWPRVWLQRAADVGLGRAINDRLRRAAAQG